MNTRQILVICCLFIVFFSVMTIASANDNVNNISLSAANDQNTIQMTDNHNEILQDPPGTFSELESEIQSTPEDNTLLLSKNYTYSGGHVIDISKSITINGQNNELDAEKEGAIFNIAGNSHVTLKNIIFVNAKGVNGSAVKVNSGSYVDIINCTFNNNNATDYGGAVYIESDDSGKISKITNSYFNNNNASKGGAIYISAPNTIINLTAFNENTAVDDGAGVYVAGDYCNISNSNFTKNIAWDDGAAVYWEGNNGTIFNISCVGNRGISGYNPAEGKNSTSKGGSICLTGSNVTISKSNFTDSNVKSNGGALFITGNENDIVECLFGNCASTGQNGGALYIIGNNTNVLGCEFENCNANLSGGVIYVEGHDALIDHGKFTGNGANLEGAALYVAGDNCTLSNSTFTGNIAGDDGGAVYWKGDNGIIYNITCNNNKGISKTKPDGVNTSSTRGGTLSVIGNNLTLSKSSFTASEAYIDAGKDSSKVDGGAIFITGNDVIINETEFKDCTAVNNGGAIYIIGNNTQILNCSFDTTHAYIGGAIFIDGLNTLVNDSLFRHNLASGHSAEGVLGGSGGAIYVQGDSATISNSDFAYGDAINYGGAISVWGDDVNITENVFDNCTTTLYDGGSIFIYGADASISRSNFTRSTAKNDYAHGGAIEISGSDAKVLDCNFEYCYAYLGGVIHISGSNTLVDNSTFKHSSKYGKKNPYQGGAIFVAGVNANISKSNFSDYSSEQEGGAIFINGANTVIDKSNFDNCQGTYGGDIYVFGNYAKIYDSTFESSTATYGGAVYLTVWGALIKDSNVTDCTASKDGGAIYVAGGGTNIVGSKFEGCIAKGNVLNVDGGGAIYIDGPDTHISTSQFNSNEVTGRNAKGGTIYIKGKGTIIEESNFNKSHASKDGGIIYIVGEKTIIKSSTFNNSYSSDKGGAISINGTNTTIDSSKFENVYSSSNGGAIYVDGQETKILRSSFYECVAKGTNSGGAIYIGDIKTVVAFSNFTLCTANTAGAIYISGENTQIMYCNLDNNTAKSAGAIMVFGNDTIISNTNFTCNNATYLDGGALDIGGSNASVYSCWFDRNDAIRNGGAINWKGGHGDDTILGSRFTNNACHGSKEGGGAIFWTSGDPNFIPPGGLILNCIFINNTAYGHHGGAIDWYYASNSTINNCLFVNNTAYGDGGALYTGDQAGKGYRLMMSNNQFYNNTAKKHGGAIANQMSDSWIYNNTFDGNKAMASGGTILMKEGHADGSVIDHCYIYNSFANQTYPGNTYGLGGGAIRISDNNITISNCAIINSTVNKTWGGAIYANGKGSSLINVTIQDVAVLDGYGGAIYWAGPNGKMNNVTIFNSSSNIIDNSKSESANGGAIYLRTTDCILDDIKISKSSTNNNYQSNSKSGNGGAICVIGASNTLTNIQIDDSSASSVKMNFNGGAIYWDGNSGTLINASISNTLANGRGGAIYWKGNTPTISDIYIEYSQTNVTNSANSADGGAIYLDNVHSLNNVYIINALASRDTGNIQGGAICFQSTQGINSMNNVTVIGSRASTGNGNSYGGAVYLNAKSDDFNVYNSSFVENTADYGGAVYSVRPTNIWNTSFRGNVALDGGALFGYGTAGDDVLNNASFSHNSAKRGGAIFVNNHQIRIYDSSLEFNTAEEKGGAIYYNNVNMNHNRNTEITRTNLTNNTAFQGSAIYGNKFRNVYLQDVVLLDNQANSNKFIEKAVGYDEHGNNYTTAVFVGFDNLLNAIWHDGNDFISCDNVTYWDVGGRTVTYSPPLKSDREANINVTVETYNGLGQRINVANLTTDENGRIYYIFDAKEGEEYYFAYVHESDRYYTYLRDTLSNRSLVNLFVDTPLHYGDYQSFLIYLTDGAWGEINGTVYITFNDTAHTSFSVDVVNGSQGFPIKEVFNLMPGTYNVTARYDGDINHTGDSDWKVFEILPYTDMRIVKESNVTDIINATDKIEFKITVYNDGPCDATNVSVSEYLDYHLLMISNTPSKGVYNYTNSTWYIGDLANGTNATLKIIAQVIYSGNITNAVMVTCHEDEMNYTNNRYAIKNITAKANVDLNITKEVNVTGFINVTDKIKFTITVTNNGPANATGVFVGETLDSHLELISYDAPRGTTYDGYTWNIGILDKDEVLKLIIIARAISAGNITNAVTITGNDNDTNKSNNNDSIKNITALPIVDLAITKTVNIKNTVVNVSDIIIFTITLKNKGPCDATDVNVTEALSPHLRLKSYSISDNHGRYDVSKGIWYVGTLTNQSVAVLTIESYVISNGTISNVVVATSRENDTNKSNNKDSIKNITALPVVDLRITKWVNVSGVVNVTDKIKFVITVFNAGPSNATNVNVSEALSPYLHLESYSISDNHGRYDAVKGIWYVGKLNNQSRAVLTIEASVISNGTISNVVVVTSSENDTNKSNNRDEIDNITAQSIVDLEINKTVNVSVTKMNIYDWLEFTITVKNNGPCNATYVYVAEPLSFSLKMSRYYTDYGSFDGYTWKIGNLANGSTATLKIVAQIMYSGNITNEVNVTCAEVDTNLTNNRDNITTIVVRAELDRGVTKTVNVTGIVNVTNLIKFTITAYNNGPFNASGVYVLEGLDPHLELVNYTAPRNTTYDGYTWFIGFLDKDEHLNLTIIARVTSPGNFTNYVKIFGWDNDTDPSNDEFTIENITAISIVDVKITKDVNVTGFVNVTDKIRFEITVTNDGPCNATGIDVLEALSDCLGSDYYWDATKGIYDGYTWSIGDLKVGESATLIIIANVTKVGTLSNEVNVTVFEKDTNITNNHANITNITVLPIVDLKVIKTVDVTRVNVTDYITYTISLINLGPWTATDVNVFEHLSPLVEFVRYNTWIGTYDSSTNIWHIDELIVNSPVWLELTVKVIANGTIENTVTVTSHENDTNKSNNNYTSDNVTALPIVDIKIAKSVNKIVVNVTDQVIYTIVVKNEGPCNATGVVVVDKLDPRLEFLYLDASRSDITYDSKSGIALIGNLKVNEIVILNIIAKVIGIGEIPNTVNVTSNENDTDKSNNNGSSDNVTALPIVDVEVNKTVNVVEARYGDDLTYVITVRNNGPSDATNVNVFEKLSDYVTLVRYVSDKGTYDVDKNIWHVGNLANGETSTLTLVVKVISLGIIENSVVVTSSENDTDPTNNNYTSDNVTVVRLDTPIELYTYDITYGDDENLVVVLPDDAIGTVNITVGGRTYTDVPIENGKVILPVDDLAAGNYTVDVTYGGDVNFVPNSTSGTFNVARAVPVITIEVVDIWVGEIEVLNVTVNAPGTVNVTVYGITVTISLDNGVVTTDVLGAGKNSYLGNSTWNLVNLPVGAYPAFAIYPGNENYTSVNISDLFHVRNIPTKITVKAKDIYIGEEAIIHIKVGPKGVTGNVDVIVDGVKYVVPIRDGKAVLYVSDLPAGKYDVYVRYNGTTVYLPSDNSTTFKVHKLKPPVHIDAPAITVGKDGVITVTVPDDATGTITIDVDGKRYTAPIKNGKAIFVIPGLKVGKHKIVAYYSGDDKYLSANTTGSIKVNPLDENKTDNETTVSGKYSHGRASLEKYPTGNPIWMILCVLLSIATIRLNRFKK